MTTNLGMFGSITADAVIRNVDLDKSLAVYVGAEETVTYLRCQFGGYW